MQPSYSKKAVHHTVSLRRVIGSGQVLCPFLEDERPPEILRVGSKSYTRLEEFSVYTFTARAIFDNNVTNTSTNFTTPSRPPSAAPFIASSSVTRTSITIVWDLPCRERNGIILGYSVEFGPKGGISEVLAGDQNFIASGLSPSTEYVLRAAGFNVNGTGPIYMTTILSGGAGMLGLF